MPPRLRAAMPTRLWPQSPIGKTHEYRTPMEHHNPMECFGSTAVWDGDGR